MKKYYTYLLFVILSSWQCSAMAVLLNGSVLNFTTSLGSGTQAMPADGNGSWFGVEPGSFGVVGITSFDGLVVGSIQDSTGTHSGVPDGSESPTIAQPFDWYSNTGMLSTVSTTDILSASGNTATLDFTGIRWDWVTENIQIYSPFFADSGIASITCGIDCGNGDSFVLDYSGHIEPGGPSGLGGELVMIHLEGTISAVPLPASAWLLISGISVILGVFRKNNGNKI